MQTGPCNKNGMQTVQRKSRVLLVEILLAIIILGTPLVIHTAIEQKTQLSSQSVKGEMLLPPSKDKKDRENNES